MNSYLKRVKLYVVIFAILVAGVSMLIANGLQKNTFFTVDHLERTLKSFRIKSEYESSFLRAAQNNKNSQATTSNRFNFSQSVPVLVYHGILEHDESESADHGSEGAGIYLDTFKDHMFFLKKAGYTTISTEDLYVYLKNGGGIPEKSILITFDDGRKDSFKHADPIFKALGFKATMFVIGKFGLVERDQQYYLSSKKIREMARSDRWDIQAHSHDGHNSYLIAPNQADGHFFSHKFWIPEENRLETDEEFSARITEDLRRNQFELQELIGRPVHGFAYPFGDFGQNETNYAEARTTNLQEAAKLYSMVFYQNDSRQRYTQNYFVPESLASEFFPIKRININPEWSGEELILALERGTPKVLPYNDQFNTDNGWRTFWGDIFIDQNQLFLQPKEDETGGTIILDGTRAWKDYSVTSTVSSPNRSSVYVWIRFQNDENNAACDFGNGHIHIEQTINGQHRVIKGEVGNHIQLPSGDFTVTAEVKGRTIRCILNGTQVVESQFLDQSLPTGGIGFKTWSTTPGLANLIIKQVTVNEL